MAKITLWQNWPNHDTTVKFYDQKWSFSVVPNRYFYYEWSIWSAEKSQSWTDEPITRKIRFVYLFISTYFQFELIIICIMIRVKHSGLMLLHSIACKFFATDITFWLVTDITFLNIRCTKKVFWPKNFVLMLEKLLFLINFWSTFVWLIHFQISHRKFHPVVEILV